MHSIFWPCMFIKTAKIYLPASCSHSGRIRDGTNLSADVMRALYIFDIVEFNGIRKGRLGYLTCDNDNLHDQTLAVNKTSYSLQQNFISFDKIE